MKTMDPLLFLVTKISSQKHVKHYKLEKQKIGDGLLFSQIIYISILLCTLTIIL